MVVLINSLLQDLISEKKSEVTIIIENASLADGYSAQFAVAIFKFGFSTLHPEIFGLQHENVKLQYTLPEQHIATHHLFRVEYKLKIQE